MSNSDSPQFVSRSAFEVLSGTLLSRVTGFVRDMAMAFYFGAEAPLAAFLLAYRFVYLFRRLFGEGLLHQGFIPRFEEYRAQSPQKAARFFRDLFGTLALILIGILIIGEGVLLPMTGEVAHYSRLMLPGVVFLCLFGMTTGLLNTEKSFFLPAVSPAAFNVVWIAGVVALSHWPIRQAISGLSILIAVALLMQLALTLPRSYYFLRDQLSRLEVFSIRPFSSELRGLISPLLLAAIGVGAVQVNSAIDGVFARFAAPEGPAYLWYAIRMQQLPFALFALALSSVLFPSLSRAFERGDQKEFQELIDTSVGKVFFLLLPCTIGIFVLGASSVNLLFGRGGFDELATSQTIQCLWGYGIGLIPMALTQILAPAYYAQKDYKTPSLAFAYSSLLNVGLNALFVFLFDLGPASIALATSSASLFNLFYLRKYLHVRAMGSLRLIAIILISGVVTLIFGNSVLQDATLSLSNFTRSPFLQLYQFGAQAVIFFGLIGSLLFLARIRD